MEAAQRIGITISRISYYERGLQQPLDSTLDRIRAVYIDLDEIIEDTKTFWV